MTPPHSGDDRPTRRDPNLDQRAAHLARLGTVATRHALASLAAVQSLEDDVYFASDDSPGPIMPPDSRPFERFTDTFRGITCSTLVNVTEVIGAWFPRPEPGAPPRNCGVIFDGRLYLHDAEREASDMHLIVVPIDRLVVIGPGPEFPTAETAARRLAMLHREAAR